MCHQGRASGQQHTFGTLALRKLWIMEPGLSLKKFEAKLASIDARLEALEHKPVTPRKKSTARRYTTRRSTYQPTYQTLWSHSNLMSKRTVSRELVGSEDGLEADSDGEQSVESSENSLVIGDDGEFFNSEQKDALVLARHSTHAVAESIWEAAIVLHLSEDVWEDFFGYSCLILNIAVQLMFSYVVGFALSTDRFPSMDSLRNWRNTVGHDVKNVDLSTWTSLTSRVCNGDDSLAVASGQQSLLARLQLYMDGVSGVDWVPTGVALSACVVVLWCLYVADELWRVVSFVRSLVLIPRGKTVFRAQSGEFVLEGISVRRLHFMFFITFVRVIIALLIMFSGSLWLSRTGSVGEMLLNCWALNFVLEVDELFFSALMPLRSKIVVRNLAPLHRKPVVFRNGMDMEPPLNIMVMVAAAFLSLHFVLMPGQQHLKEMKHTMCGGNQDFVIGQVAVGDMLSTSTVPFGALPPDNDTEVSHALMLHAAVQEAIHAESPNATRLSFYVPDRAMYRSNIVWSTHDFSTVEPDCLDMDHLHASWSRTLPLLQDEAELASGRSCEDFRPRCTDPGETLLRLRCPVTCGCASPLSGLIPQAPVFGCPAACHSSPGYMADLRAHPCQDGTPTSLMAMSGWTSYWDQFVPWTSMMGFPADLLSRLREDFLENGCAALARADLYNDSATTMFCSPSGAVASLHAFCPEACGCSAVPAMTCPLACYDT